MTLGPVLVPASVQAAFDLINRAAEAGAKCPSNTDIADAMGRAKPEAGTNAVALLETLGLIEVTRFSMARHVRIVSTGAETKRPNGLPLRYLPGRKRAVAWRTRELEEAFADAISEHGNVSQAAKDVGVTYDQGRVLFATIRRALGRQAA